jgi:hypothetical protein
MKILEISCSSSFVSVYGIAKIKRSYYFIIFLIYYKLSNSVISIIGELVLPSRRCIGD